MAAVVVEARKNGARHPVVVLARQAAHRRGVPARADALRPDLPLRLRHPGRRRRRLRPHLRRTGPGPAAPPGVRRRATRAARRLAGVCRCTGRSTTSWTAARRRPGGCGRARASRPSEVDLPQVYDGFSPFVWFWLEVLGLCPVGEAHRFVEDGRHRQRPPGCDSRALGRRRARATAACTASRRCSSATCSCRDGPVTGSATSATIGLGLPFLAALRWRGCLQRGGILRVVLLDLAEYRSTVTGVEESL